MFTSSATIFLCAFIVVCINLTHVSSDSPEKIDLLTNREDRQSEGMPQSEFINDATKSEIAKANITNASPVISNSSSQVETLDPEDPTKSIDFSKPGVLKRAVIVFGGFGLLGLAYFIFYRRRQNKNASDDNGPSDGPQFRYGVLHSDEHSDRMELSHMPLTMESEDDDEDDLEIFDLGEKKQSLYANVNTDEHKAAVDDIMAAAGSSWNREQLLLDIDEKDTPAVLTTNAPKFEII